MLNISEEPTLYYNYMQTESKHTILKVTVPKEFPEIQIQMLRGYESMKSILSGIDVYVSSSHIMNFSYDKASGKNISTIIQTMFETNKEEWVEPLRQWLQWYQDEAGKLHRSMI